MIKKNNFILQFFLYLLSIGISTILYISLFWTDLFLSNDNFSRSLKFLLILTSILFLILTFVKNYKNNYFRIIYKDILIIVLIFFSFNWFIYGLIPFNVSRSNSVIILGYLKGVDSPKNKNEIEKYVLNKYFVDYDAIAYRLNEQINSGNIILTKDGYRITAKGILVSKIVSAIAELYNIKHNFLETYEDL